MSNGAGNGEKIAPENWRSVLSYVFLFVAYTLTAKMRPEWKNIKHNSRLDLNPILGRQTITPQLFTWYKYLLHIIFASKWTKHVTILISESLPMKLPIHLTVTHT